MAPKLKLVYFRVEGRGEAIRIICRIGGVCLEEEFIEFLDWPNKKPNYPFNALPVLVVDDTVTVPETIAICRYVAKLAKLTGKNELEDAQIDAVVDACNGFYQDFSLIWAPTVMNSNMTDFKKVVVMRLGEDAKKYEGHPELKAAGYKQFAEKAVNPKLDKFEEILGKSSSGWFVGDKMTWADVFVAEFMHRMETHVEPGALVSYPKEIILKAVIA